MAKPDAALIFSKGRGRPSANWGALPLIVTMMSKLRYIPISMLLAVFILSGCASMRNRFHTCNTKACCVSPIRMPHYVYPGTQSEMRNLAIPFWSSGDALYDGITCMFYPVFLVDLPLSFVADTLFLPYDIYMITAGGKTRYRKDIRRSGQPPPVN